MTSLGSAADRTGEVHIDASEGEGGGQIVRNAVSLAVLLRRPITVDKIRANRPRGGLMAQHLTGVRLICRDLFGDVCHVQGDELHSTSLNLKFDKSSHDNSDQGEDHVTAVPWKRIRTDIGTAGACTLLVQIALPCLLFAPHVMDIHISGGTNVAYSPPVDEMKLVLFPLLQKLFGFCATLDIVKRGFYPRGGGKLRLGIVADTSRLPLRAFDMIHRGRVSTIHIHGFASKNQIKTQDVWREQLVDIVVQCLGRYDSLKGVPIEIHDAELIPEHQCSLTLVAKTENDICLFAVTEMLDKSGRHYGKKGKHKGREGSTMLKDCKGLAERAVKRLIKEIGPPEDESLGPCADSHVQDQLIVFMALAQGTSRLRCAHPLTMHTTSAIHICRTLTGATFTVTQSDSSATCVIECQGIGYTG